MQIQTDSVKQASAILRGASRLIASLADHLTITPECEELVVAIKEHLELAWVVQTQVYSLPIPSLVRTPTTQSMRLAGNTETALVPDSEYQTYPICDGASTPPTTPPFSSFARITTFDSRFNDLPQKMPSLMRLSSVIATPFGEHEDEDEDEDDKNDISSTPFRLRDQYPDSECEQDDLLIIPRPLLTRQTSSNVVQEQDEDEDPFAMPTMTRQSSSSAGEWASLTRQTSATLPPSSLQDTTNSLSMKRGITYYDPLNEHPYKSNTR